MEKVTLFRQSCKGVEDCGICIFVCPKKLFEGSDDLNEAGYLLPRVKDEKRCTQCQNCMIYCPDLAVAVAGRSSRSSGKGGGRDE